MLRVTIPNFTLKSSWGIVYSGGGAYVFSPQPNTAQVGKTYSLADIPAGSTINSALLWHEHSLNRYTYSQYRIWISGTAYNWDVNGIWRQKDVTAAVQAALSSGSISFTYEWRGTKSPIGTTTGSFDNTVTFTTPSIDIEFTLPYATKVWNGSSWANGTPYVWNGSSWVAGVSYVWNGSAWMPGKT